MNTSSIRDLLAARERAVKELQSLRNEAESFSLNGHQNAISVFIGGCQRCVDVAAIGGREVSWQSTLVRGREMILLGAKKAYAAMIERTEKELSAIDEQIRRETA